MDMLLLHAHVFFGSEWPQGLLQTTYFRLLFSYIRVLLFCVQQHAYYL